MVFSSLLFLGIFLPACLLLYNIGPKSVNNINLNMIYKNTILVIFSVVFYAWGEPKLILLLVATAFIGWVSGLVIDKYRESIIIPKISLIVALVICLGSLGIFKYTGFFISNINTIFGANILFPGFALPLGISFYTFQILSYVIDMYRGEIRVQKSFLKFMTYVSMFPQLVAGPIVRYIDIQDEIDYRVVTAKNFESGILRFCQGLAKKVILANSAGQIADSLLQGDLSGSSAATVWFGIIMYTFQIYFDFSGYSDLAIGMGKFFGFTFMENFNYPYISKSITDFWRRWHISLSTFFRDYVYIPLGGNRKHHIFNIMVVWILTGFWHGASWNFVLWGLFYGILLIVEKKAFGGKLLRLPAWLGHIYTMIVVVFGWALFYFTDFGNLKQFFKTAFGGSGVWIDLVAKSTVMSNIWLIILLAICSTPLLRIVYRKLSKLNNVVAIVLPVVTVIGIMGICYALLVGQSYNAFLYFRF